MIISGHVSLTFCKYRDRASHWANLQRKLIVLICLHLGQLSSFWAREWTSKIMTMFYALFLLCCLLFLGQCSVSMSQKKYGAYAPSTTKLSRGICPRLTANESFFHFGQLFNASCSPLRKILICSSLFPLHLPSGVVLPCCDVYTAISRKVVGKKRKSARDNPVR